MTEKNNMERLNETTLLNSEIDEENRLHGDNLVDQSSEHVDGHPEESAEVSGLNEMIGASDEGENEVFNDTEKPHTHNDDTTKPITDYNENTPTAEDVAFPSDSDNEEVGIETGTTDFISTNSTDIPDETYKAAHNLGESSEEYKDLVTGQTTDVIEDTVEEFTTNSDEPQDDNTFSGDTPTTDHHDDDTGRGVETPSESEETTDTPTPMFNEAPGGMF